MHAERALIRAFVLGEYFDEVDISRSHISSVSSAGLRLKEGKEGEGVRGRDEFTAQWEKENEANNKVQTDIIDNGVGISSAGIAG